MVTQAATRGHHPSEAAVTSTSKPKVNNLTIRKAFILTAKAFRAGYAGARQPASSQPKLHT